MPFVPDSDSGSIGRFVADDETDSKERSAGTVAADLAKGLGGAAVSAVGAVPVAAGRLIREGGETLLGMSMEESQTLAESAGTPEKALDWYEKSNRFNPVSLAGRGIEAAGNWITKQGDDLRDARTPQAKEKARLSTPDGDITQPSTWTMGQDPSVEGVAQVLSDVTGSMAPAVASAVATRGKSAATQMQVGGTVTAGQIGGGAMDEATQYLGQFDDAKLRTASPVFRDLEAKGYSAADARTIILREAQNKAGAYAAPVGYAGGKATAALLGKPGEALAGKIGSTAAKAAVLGALGASEEGLQEVGEGVATRAGINDATGMERSLTEGTFGEFVLGAKGGGTMSAGKVLLDRATQGLTDGEGQPAPAATPGAPAPATAYPDPVSRGTAPAEPTEAEKALRTPTSLTALDRAGEISQEQARLTERLAELSDPAAGYGQMFDQERQQLAERAQALAAERDEITKTWPKAEPGQATSFTTEAGVRLDGQYALMNLDDLVTSHDANLRQNPLYPAELQPRARDRAASEMQISGIVGKLDPARLGLSADAATGAPIVGADGLVESGNARTIALKRVYQANGQKAADYRQFLQTNAAQFGLSPEQIQAMDKPVLVRVRSTPVNRAEFARQANASTVAAMSPSEQAKSDAARIDSMEDLRPDDQGDFQNSRDFIRRFMARLPATEQSGMIDAGGALSSAGYARVRNAVLAKAYGDSAVLTRMVESMDDNLRNVSKALMTAAPKVAQMRQAVAAGQRFDADITPDLMAAVEELSRLKDAGTSIEDALAQAGMFGEKYSQETRDLLQFLADNIRRPRRMADFIVAYMDALDAAGDPNQGSLLGDTQAPAKSELLAAAGRTVQGEPDAQGSDLAPEAGQDAGAGQQGGGQRQDAQGGESRAQGAGAAAPAGTEGEWVAFGLETGTLGIPRAQMPQVKNKDRGALINFLEARGIANEPDRVRADELKPTQAEYSRNKVDKFVETGAMGERSVLISSDGHVLDGHHQWLGHKERGEEINVIRLDSPIRELLEVVNAFPSVKRSEGAADVAELRAAAVKDFKDAMADLATIASKHTRAAMIPEDTPGLKPALIKLFTAAFRIVGTDMRSATRWVREQLRKDPATKKIANFIKTSTMEEAAREALALVEKDGGAQGGLFDSPEAASQALQSDLFGAQAPSLDEPVKVAKINGRAYDMKRDNYKAQDASKFVSPELLAKANALISEFFKGDAKPAVNISESDRSKAEEALRPLLKRAQDAKPTFDQAVIDVAASHGIGQLIAPLKSIGRSAEKVVNDYQGDVAQIADLLRATVIVQSYADAAAVISVLSQTLSIEKIKNKAGADLSGLASDLLAKVRNQDRAVFGGYADVSLVARTGNGVLSEIQINIPSMMAVKDAQGHALYEAARIQEDGSKAKRELDAAMAEVYDEAFAFRDAERRASATQPKNAASEPAWQRDTGAPGSLTSTTRSSSSRNQPESGKRTNSSPLNDDANSQPAGNASGTGIDIKSPLNNSVSQLPANGYTGGDLFGADDATVQPGGGSTQGKGAGAAQKPGRGGNAARVRNGSGRAGVDGDRDADTGGPGAGELGQPGAGGVRAQDGDGAGAEPGDRAGRPAGVPAGRDIPPKSGRNYQFGPDDLTYAGSWLKKAEQNVEAVELLRTLEKEGRQATPAEQASLAKFVGWGSSDMANNLFGKKLDGAAEALEKYDEAIQKLGDKPYLTNRLYSEYFPAFRVLQIKDPSLNWYTAGNITRDMLDKARPDPSARKWLALRDRLRAAMSEEELADASRSTQYAHYTSKEVVSSMWKAMERMGFKGGTILEPGAGIGVFPGLMPQAMAANSIYTGIEFDPVTGGVLKQLFPDERILVESFVDSKLPKNFYDVAIGNPPFSGTKILGDPEYAKQALSLHDYFFAKSIDRVKPGGLVVYVTSRYTMDKLDDKARAYLAQRADLVGAIRLPQTAFKQNAGTEVVTDVIFLRKKVKGETFEGAQAWAKAGEIKGADGKTLMVKDQHGTLKPAMVNEYFAAHPEMVLGQHGNTGSMYSDQEYTVTPLDGNIADHFAKAVENLPADIYQAQRGSSAEAAKVREIDFNPKAKKEGNYYVSDKGELMVREGGVGQRVELRSPKDAEIIKDFVPLRDALKQAHYDQLNDGEWETSLKALQAAYAKFTKKNGKINQFVEKTVKVKVDELDEDGDPTGKKVDDEEVRRTFPLLDKLKDDPDWTLVAALEKLNDDTGEITDSDFLSKRVLAKQAAANVSTPVDALLTTLNDLGKVDIEVIAQRIGMSQADTIEALGSAVYNDPEQGWVTADEYLSGNVKAKLEIARQAAKSDRSMERNVTALEANQPEPLQPSQIDPRLGMNWIPGKVYQDFIADITGGQVKATVEWSPRTKNWDIKEVSGGKTDAATAEWGTLHRNVVDLLEVAVTGRQIRIETRPAKGEAPVFDAGATEAANEKLKALHEKFAAWVFTDPDRTDMLVRLYNDKFNTNVARKFDGRHLTLPGSTTTIDVFPHVKRGAWRIVQSGNTYLAHAVGSGKTWQMVISAMEQKRLGLVKKPMMVVPNHMLKQFAAEWLQLYPAARLMVADENNFHMDNRRRFVSRVALSDLDGVIITHSAFKMLDLDPEFKAGLIKEQLTFFRAALEEAGGNPDKLTYEQTKDPKTGKLKLKGKGSGSMDPKVKRIEKQLENMEQKLLEATSSEGKDKNVRFDELGVDFLYVDEAHEYRKLDFTTVRQVKGISPQGSARAFDLYMKSRYLESKTPGRSMVMASGTPVTNTVAELYTVQKMMGHQSLVDKGIEDFDSWAAMFGREKTQLESNAAGKYEAVTRFQDFSNVPELTQMFREFADVLTSDHLAQMLGDKRPKVEGGARSIVVTPMTEEYKEFRAELAARMDVSKAWKPSKDQPNNPDPVIRIIGDGRLAAIDMRFMRPGSPSNPDSKLNRMADDVIKAFKETADMEYTDKAGKVEPNKGAAMMVFSDLGFGAGVAASRGFNARAWFEKRLRDAGIPMNQVAFMGDYKKSAEKLKLFKDVNAGRVRILIGSSKNMGTGVNAQQRLKHLFHLDSPWYPADLEQREGRIIRQGNKNPLVNIHAYAAKGSYDQQMWGQLAGKQEFIDKAMSGDPNVRKIEDAGAADLMAMVSGMVADDPRVLQLAGLNTDIGKLQRLYQAHEDTRATHRSRYREASSTASWNEKRLPKAIEEAKKAQDLSGDNFKAKVGSTTYTERAKWAEDLIAKYKDLTDRGTTEVQKVGEISGFDIAYGGETIGGQYMTKLMLATPDPVALVTDAGTSPMGMVMRAQNAIADLARLPAKMRERISEARAQMDALQTKTEAAFPMAGMLAEKIRERDALQAEMARPDQPENGASFGTLYHGAAEAFEEFDPARMGTGNRYDHQGQAWYLTDDRQGYARFFALQAGGLKDADSYGTVMSVSLDPKAKILDMRADGVDASVAKLFKDAAGNREQGAALKARVQELGFDGLAFIEPNAPEGVKVADGALTVAVYNPAMVKVESSEDGAGVPRLSRGTATGGIAVRDLQAVVDRVSKGLKNLPKVHVFASPADLSSKVPDQKSLRDFIKKQGAMADAEGGLHNGEIYLFASGLADEARAEHVLATHEITHYGLRGAMGKDLDAALQHVWVNNAAIRKQAAALRQRLKLDSNLGAVEEVLADIPASELVKLKGWRRVVKVARDWLNRIGATSMAARLDAWMTAGLDEQARADLFVADLLTAAREWVRTGRGGRGGSMADVTRLSSLAEDAAKQEQWLNAEAKARGYKDIEDLLEKDYPVFEKLAAKWREKNPASDGVMLSRGAKSITDTPAFRKWFGGSKVVDDQGNPLVVYHGTSKKFSVFAPSNSGTFGPGIYFANTRKSAETYGASRVVEAYAAIRNPWVVSVENESDAALAEDFDSPVVGDVLLLPQGRPLVNEAKKHPSGHFDQKLQDALVRLGHDGIMATYPDGSMEIVAFRPEQIKSAIGNSGNFDPENPDIRLSRAPQAATPAERADKIIATKTGSRAPLDFLARTATRITGVERLTGAIYRKAGYLLDKYTPEQVKAGVVADYGVPDAVIDQRAMMQGRQRVQLRKAGTLIEKLSTLTRAESRVAYEWMNRDGSDPKAYLSAMEGLPEDSVKVLQEVQQLVDKLSREAMAMGQLSPEAYERNRFAYLRRSYAKHVLEQDSGEKAKRSRVISILGDQYKGRGLTEAAPMARIQNIAPDWWKRKLQAGKADASLKGEKFVRLERRAPAGAGTQALPGMTTRPEGKLLEVAYYPAGQVLPAQFKDWEQSGTFEVRDVKGPNLILWRDFTKEEREQMGEVDEARFAIAKTLHGMIHDVEVGRYLEWISHTYGKKEGETIPGTVVEASERYRDTFAPGEWVQVPDSKIPGTQVAKYGKLAGRYIPGPIWNDLRQVVGGQFKPFGDTYAKILTLWKTAKTALSPAVHMNNVMSNFVMADWHDVGAAHVAKSLRLILAASQRQGVGILGRVGNAAARAGISDREAALEVLNRYKDSGGDIGSWVTNEISRDQLEPLLAGLEKELAATAGASNQAQVGVFSALQHAMMLRFPSAWEAFKGSKPGKAVGNEAQSLIDLYQHEDDVFRLAAWLKAKEDGMGDLEAGKAARKSFLDYHINAPWIAAMRATAWPFISFTYRAVPMMLETAAKKPHKLMKLMMIAGGLNALGAMLAGGDDEEERKLLPEEKAGKIWGMVPKLIRMPWNDQNNHPVYLDIRRYIPVGDVFDVGQGHSAVPILPGMQPGGPMALAAEVVVNRSMFTGKPITLDTDNAAQKSAKLGDYLYKAFAPNVLGLPGTYATTGVANAAKGKTDAFGREQSVAQAVASSFGVKLGSYPADVLKLNLTRKTQAELMEIDRNITLLKRQRMTNQIDQAEFEKLARVEQEKQRELIQKVREKLQ